VLIQFALLGGLLTDFFELLGGMLSLMFCIIWSSGNGWEEASGKYSEPP
jgi:hypothetical protein